MSITKMNVLDIMAEACKTVTNTDGETVDAIVDDVADAIEACGEMTTSFTYTPEMVPVVFDESTQSYYVEYDMLKKLHESSDEEYGEEIEVVTKYGKIEFKPKLDIARMMAEPGDKAIQEEEPKDCKPCGEENPDETIPGENPEEVPPWENMDESSLGYYYPQTITPSFSNNWEKDALNQVILANMPQDPNKGCESDSCPGMPEMTMENTYIVIESERELFKYIYQVSEAAKCGGKAMKNGKDKLKKASETIKKLKKQGLKVVKKAPKNKNK